MVLPYSPHFQVTVEESINQLFVVCKAQTQTSSIAYLETPISRPLSSSEESACNAEDAGSISGSGRLSEKEMATHSSTRLRSPMDRGAWRDIVHGVAKESNTT